MRLFVNGGSGGAAAAAAYKRFAETADKSRPMLFIPFALEPENYDSAYIKVKKELSAITSGIDMVTSGAELRSKYMGAYGRVFMCDGNTFRLLDELKSSGGFEMLLGYMRTGGVLFGEGAGAAILGADIEGAVFSDANDAGLSDTAGLDLLGGASVFPKYRVSNKQQQRFLSDYSMGRIVFALPADSTIYINNDDYELIGSQNAYQFVNGKKTTL